MQVRQALTIGENPLKRKPKVKTTKSRLIWRLSYLYRLNQ